MPAVTFGVSTNFALSNFLASRSFGNVLVALANARFPCGSSNETYHVPWDFLAMRLSQATPAAPPPWAGPQSKANEIVPLAARQFSGLVFRYGRGFGLPLRPKTHQRRSAGIDLNKPDRVIIWNCWTLSSSLIGRDL